MKLAISNIAWGAAEDDLIYSWMRDYGFSGLEIAPTRIFPDAPYKELERAKDWAKMLKRAEALDVASMQSIWFGRKEMLFGSEAERQTLLDYTKMAVDFAEALGCKNLVFGCPRNRMRPENASEDIALSFFKEIGDYASKHGTCIGLEANPVIYGTNFINTTPQAMELIKRVKSPGLRLNFDLGTLIANDENIEEALQNVEWINHVHISEPFLKPIEKRALHRVLMRDLNAAGYKGWVSIEMGRQEELSIIKNTIQEISRLAELQ